MNKNQCAVTPPMGWNSWDYYGTMVNEEQVKANADVMAARLKAYGWEYIVVDIEWYDRDVGKPKNRSIYVPFGRLEMDAYGRLLPDPARFPSSAGGAGFKPLADYVHGLGLKFGIHIMRGIPRAAAHNHLPVMGSDQTADEIANPSSICGWNPDMYGLRRETAGSQAYYDSILKLYASWGVDYIKCDDICNTNLYPHDPYSGAHEIEMLHHAIEACGRPIVLSLSPGPALIDKAWHYEKYANMWRITDDFWDTWELLKDMFSRCELWQRHVGPGCFPDCDMLPLGKIGYGFGFERTTQFTQAEQVTMMTLWCMFRAPLILGADLTQLDAWTLSLLTNKAVLSLLKDGRHGVQVCRDGEACVWANWSDAGEELCVALFNFKDEEAVVSVSIEEVASMLPAAAGEVLLAQGAEGLRWKELWSGEEVCVENAALLKARVALHGAALYQSLF